MVDGQADPVGWMSGTLGSELWSAQTAIVNSVRDNRATAVHACHGLGKSFLAARIVAWWIGTHPVGKASVVTTAPSALQVKGVLWQEIASAHTEADGKLPGYVNQTDWWADGRQLAIGRKPPDGKAEVSFQGFHNEFVLAVIDEASGIPDSMWEAVNKIVTGDNDRILAIGNPDHVQSRWWKVCQGGRWNVIHVGAHDTPTFTGEPVPEGASLISQKFIDDIIEDFGEDSPQYRAQVLGEFPDDRTDGVVPWSAVSQCRKGLAFDDPPSEIVLGADIGGGGDETVVWERVGPVVGRVWRDRTDTADGARDLIVRAIDESGAGHVNVDITGLGWGVPDLVQAARDVTVGKANFGAGARESDRFANLRAELWWKGRTLSQEYGWDLSALDDGTVAQLCEPRWFENTRGRIQVEEKSAVKKRIGRSPDDADALLLCFWEAPETVGHAGPSWIRGGGGAAPQAPETTADEDDSADAPRTGVGLARAGYQRTQGRRF